MLDKLLLYLAIGWLIFIVIFSVLGYLGYIKGKSAKITANIFYVSTAALIIGYSYTETRNIKDFLSIIGVSILLIIIIFIFDWLRKKNIIKLYLEMLISVILSFLWIELINYLFLNSISHSYLIVYAIIFGKTIKKEFDDEKLKSKKELVVYCVVTVVVVIALFKIFDERYTGISRAERKVKTYLIEQKIYSEKDIKKTGKLSGKYGQAECVYVELKSNIPGTVFYYYYYDDNRIVEKVFK